MSDAKRSGDGGNGRRDDAERADAADEENAGVPGPTAPADPEALAADGGGPGATEDERRDREHERLSERITQQLAHQWALIRAERRTEREQPEPFTTGPSNVRPAEVPWGLDLAAAWSWRFLVIAVATIAVGWTLAYFALLTLSVVVALLIAALCLPLVQQANRIGVPRSLSSLVVVVGGLALVGLLLSYVGQTIASEANDLAAQVATGLQDIRRWLTEGPLGASDSQINQYLEQVEQAIASRAQDEEFFSQITQVGAAVGNVVAGFFIVLFAAYFFLADGPRIWAWMVRLAPRAARARVDSSGRVAWTSLTSFVRATVIVALVDAIGVMIVAAVLGVPFVVPIGVLVFLGAFVPMIGATIAGTIAILVALVDQGPLTALLMLGGVVLVQQIEGQVLQPFLMGRWVSVHPLGVIIAITAGVLVAGIAGALVAVPLAAAVNAVVLHLADHSVPGVDPRQELAADYEQLDAGAHPKDGDD